MKKENNKSSCAAVAGLGKLRIISHKKGLAFNGQKDN